MKKVLVLAGTVALMLSPAWAADEANMGARGAAGKQDIGASDGSAGDRANDTARDTARRNVAGGTQGEIETGDIAKLPEQFYNKTVSVKAEVEEVFGPNAFTLDEDQLFAGPDVLVLMPSTGPVPDGTTVIVRGTVRKLAINELEKEYKWFRSGSIRPEALTQMQDRPVIIAESVRTLNGEELVKAGDAAGTAAGDAPKTGRGKATGTDTGTDTDNTMRNRANQRNLPGAAPNQGQAPQPNAPQAD
ncbi:MAG TPA: hypothetical protein VEB21_05575 [Terriglobales bacterium]|nr:hypothetical protein [Terriglobales bacterium]